MMFGDVAFISNPFVSGYWTHLFGAGGGGGGVSVVVKANAMSRLLGFALVSSGSCISSQSPLAVEPAGWTYPRPACSSHLLVGVFFQPKIELFFPAETASQ